MKRKLIMLPIEPLDMRYSIQWKYWFHDAVIEEEDRFDLIIIDPIPLSSEIETGAFLDVCGTNYYKARQIQEISKMLFNKEINDGDVFFFHDAWFPGVEALAYMRDGLKLDFKITGCLHAGTYDPTDFISKMGMGVWGESLENSWFKIYDKLFVATEYHKSLIQSKRFVNKDLIDVTGFPLYMPTHETQEKEKIVVFPHRLTPDKQPDQFDALAAILKNEHPDWQFIKTQDIKRSKQEYYDLLGKSAIAVSFAKHENFGIAMIESVLLSCLPVVPNRLSYQELYPENFKYDSFEKALWLVEQMMMNIENGRIDRWTKSFVSMKTSLMNHGTNAIPNMLKIMDNL